MLDWNQESMYVKNSQIPVNPKNISLYQNIKRVVLIACKKQTNSQKLLWKTKKWKEEDYIFKLKAIKIMIKIIEIKRQHGFN